METLTGTLLSKPRKLTHKRKSDEAWARFLVSEGSVKGQKIWFTGPILEMSNIMKIAQKGTPLVIMGSWGQGPTRKGQGFHVCEIKDVALSAVGRVLADACRIAKVNLSPDAYERCLVQTGAISLLDANVKLSDTTVWNALVEKVGRREAECFKVLVNELMKDDIRAVAYLFEQAGLPDELPFAAHAVYRLRYRARRRGMTVAEVIRDTPWVLQQICEDRGQAERYAEKLAEYLGKDEYTRRCYVAASKVVWCIVHQGRSKGDSFVWMPVLYGWMKEEPHIARGAFDLLAKRGSSFGRIVYLDREYAKPVARRTGRWHGASKGKALEDLTPRQLQGASLPSIYHAEFDAAKLLAHLVHKPLPPMDEAALVSAAHKWAGRLGHDLDTEQQEFLRSVVRNRITVLCGEAGTGKTLAVKALVAGYKALVGRPPAVIAPTALAAYRAAEDTDAAAGAQTIHRFAHIFMDDIMDGAYQGDVSLPDEKLIIVDESSMLSPTVLSALLWSLAPKPDDDDLLGLSLGGWKEARRKNIRGDIRLVFVGDPGQLPPVGPASAFVGLIETARKGAPKMACVELLHNYRSGDTVIDAAQKARAGAPVEESADVRKMVSKNIVRECLSAVDRILDGKPFDPEHVMVLTSVRSKGDLSLVELNQALKAKYGASEAIKGTIFSLGDPVIATRNDYNRNLDRDDAYNYKEITRSAHRNPNRDDVYNGMRGVVGMPFQNGEDTIVPVEFQLGNKTVRREYYTHEMSSCLELAYASTVHRAQGGQAGHVVLVLPGQTSQSLLYTAITRCLRGGTVNLVVHPDCKESLYRQEPSGVEDGAPLPAERCLSAFALRLQDNIKEMCPPRPVTELVPRPALTPEMLEQLRRIAASQGLH